MAAAQLKTPFELGSRTWPTLEGEGLVVLVPVGSCEQHGPHLPLDTDTRIAEAVAMAVGASIEGCVVAPSIGIGASGEHQSFPGTLSIGTQVLTSVLIEVARSALPPDGSGPFRRLVFVNGHGGNSFALSDAVVELLAESRSVAAWQPRISGADAHAGFTETSLLLHLSPDVVGRDLPVGDTRPLGDIAAILETSGVSAVSAIGVLGDARGATAEAGAEIFATLVEDLSRLVRGLVDQ